MDLIAAMNNALHRKLCMWLIPELKEGVMKYLRKASDSVLRGIKSEKFHSIINNLEILLKRVYTAKKKNTEITQFHLECLLRFIKSEFLDRRIEGLKGVAEFCRKLRFSMPKQEHWTGKMMVDWISRNGILNEIFAERGHIQLIQRSPDIIKFLINEKALPEEQLELIWEATNFGTETKIEIYKVLIEFKSC